MEGVRDQRDDDVDLGDLSIEGLSIVDIELGNVSLCFDAVVWELAYADCNRVGNALGKSLCLLESPAGDDDLDTRLAENLSSWAGDETSTEQQNRPCRWLAHAGTLLLNCTHFPVELTPPRTVSNLSRFVSMYSIKVLDLLTNDCLHFVLI